MKKPVKARTGTLAGDERLLLDEVVAAFQASTGLPLALVKDPGGRGKGAGWRLALTPEPGAPERLYRPLLRQIDRAETLGAIKAELQEDTEPGVVVNPKLSAALARQCRAMDVPFLDGQGHAYLRWPGVMSLVVGACERPGRAGGAVARANGRAGRAGGGVGGGGGLRRGIKRAKRAPAGPE